MEPQFEIDPQETAGAPQAAQSLPRLIEVIADIEGALAKLDAAGLFGRGAHLSDALDALRSYRDSLQNGGNCDSDPGAND